MVDMTLDALQQVRRNPAPRAPHDRGLACALLMQVSELLPSCGIASPFPLHNAVAI